MLSATPDVRPLAQLLRALGDDIRLRIVALLSHGELCVCHIQEALDLSQPNSSRHLSVLRAAGVVTSRRDGTWIHYALAEQDDPDRASLLASLVGGFAKRRVLRRDVESLRKACGPDSCP